jgi:hypothetical protein
MIKTIKYLYDKQSWIIPEDEADEIPSDMAVKIETFCPDGLLDKCTYYVFALRPLPTNLFEAVAYLLTLLHFDAIEGKEEAVGTANMLLSIAHSDCRHLITPAKLVYELAARAGLEIQTSQAGDETIYDIKDVGRVKHIKTRTIECLLANRLIDPGPAEIWTF